MAQGTCLDDCMQLTGAKRSGCPIRGQACWTQEGLKGRVVGALGPLYFLLGTRLPLIGYYRYFLRFSCLLFPYGPCMANNAFLACELLGPPGLFWRHLLALKQVSSRRLFPYITPNPWFPAPGPYFLLL